MPLFVVRILFVLTVAVGVAGCSGGAATSTATAPVEGTVNFKGAPLAEGTIAFIPEGNNRPGSGVIKDGKILEVYTDNPGDGAPVGKCQVTISASSGGGDMYAKTTSLIPAKYQSPTESGLTAEIKSGETNKVAFELTE